MRELCLSSCLIPWCCFHVNPRCMKFPIIFAALISIQSIHLTTQSFPCALPVWVIRKTHSWTHPGKVLLMKYICTIYHKIFSQAIACVYPPKFLLLLDKLTDSYKLEGYYFSFIYLFIRRTT